MALGISILSSQRFSTSGAGANITALSWAAGDIIIFYGGLHDPLGGAGGTYNPTNSNLAFARSLVCGGGNLTGYYAAAIAASAQSSQTITINQSVGSRRGAICTWKITGATGFDPNSSQPRQSGSPVNTLGGMNSDKSNTMFFQAGFQSTTATNITTPAGWTNSSGIACSTTTGGMQSAVHTFSTPQSALSATWGSAAQGLLVAECVTSDPLASLKRNFSSIVW